MDVKIVYPLKRNRAPARIKLRRWIFFTFALGALATGICDICLPGAPFSLYVIGGEFLFYIAFMRTSPIEQRFSARCADVTLSVCAYLVLLAATLKKDWAGFVVPIVGFSLVILMGLFFLVDLLRGRLSPMPFFRVLLAGLMCMICAFLGYFEMNWPMIVLGSVALGFLIMSAVFCAKPLKTELLKRFHR